MKLDWEILLDDWDGEYCWEIGPGRIIRAPKKIWVISPTGIVSLRVRIVLRP